MNAPKLKPKSLFYETTLSKVIELLAADPTDAQAARYLLSLVVQHQLSPELAQDLYREAVCRRYFEDRT